MSVSPNSSLEGLLENLRRRVEEEKPKDLPPALPSRPRSTSGRLPSIKRLLPVGENGSGKLVDFKTGKVKKTRKNSFGSLVVKDSDLSESPYTELEVRGEDGGGEVETNSSSSKGTKGGKHEVDDNNIGVLFMKKLHFWCQLRDGKWGLGQIQSTSGDKASILLSDGSVETVFTGDLSPANPDILEGVDDLIQLSYLNEPSVLHNLRHRYSNGMIYSKAGHVLLAINPFKKVQVYGNELITAYKQKLVDNPHVYYIADAAYSQMMSEELNQSIIISGESGSGKTETAKIAMQYLAGLAGGSNGIESEILISNSILEAFGNAKTFRNDNSSRFGKLIEIHFTASGKICGAELQTFLLEKSRVVQLAQGERSYHIFYQLCAGAPSKLRDKLKLREANYYYYLNQSTCLTINDVDDANRFHNLMDALSSLKISNVDQEHVFEMLAAVLWLGNISFQVIDNGNYIDVLEDEAVKNAASLLGCSSQDLMLALSTYRIQAGRDKVAKRLTLQQAIDTRDALAKCLYANLFYWLVDEINKSFGLGKTHTGRSISVLDIYGFESHKENSFEQLCINYANERLQQHFNRHLFKLEQEEYELDGIDWTKVDFMDNQDCLDLFEKKPIGLISLLDEESNFPKATDMTFANKIKHYLDANPCFKGVKDKAFCVLHSAGEVIYDTSGFLEKNRDSLPSDTIQLLSLCKRRLPQAFAAKLLNQSLRKSVGTKFKGQLFKLMQRLETTKPHFIRCIKPNNQQIPGLYENSVVLEQLRWCGVLEVVRIARSGFPTRLTHQEFTSRYGFLLPDDGASQDPLSASVSILKQFNILPGMYQVGYTKLYFRAGQIGTLQEMRKELLEGTLEVQKYFRAHRASCYFHELKGGVTVLQSFIRGEIDRRQRKVLLNLKEDARKKLDDQLRAVVHIQSGLRRFLARKQCDRMRSSRKLVQDIQVTRKICTVKDLPSEMLPPMVEELQRHILMAEATCNEKEKENAVLREQVPMVEELQRQILMAEATCNEKEKENAVLREQIPMVEELQSQILMAEATCNEKEKENEVLREQVRQLEARQLEYEVKMKSMEDTLQQQMSALQDQQSEMVPPMVEELQRQILTAEATCNEKEKENAEVREQVQQLEARRSEYEVKMKSMEDTLQRQMSALQANLSAAKKSLGADASPGQSGRVYSSSRSPCYNDSDGYVSLQTTPGGSTPNEYVNNGGLDFGESWCSHLAKEFEEKKESFDDAVQAIASRRSTSNNVDELRILKHQFKEWKNDYKIRLKEAKPRSQKPVNQEGERVTRKWWGKKTKKLLLHSVQ